MMSQSLSLRRRLLAAAVAALALIFAGSAVVAGPAQAKTSAKSMKASKSALAGVDTGKYYVFRTRDTGAPATNLQNTRCNRHFGWRALGTITRLNALLFSYESNAGTGRIENQTKSLLGPGFLCAVPNLGKQDQLDAYAYSTLPGPGTVEASGGCNAAPVVVDGVPFLLNCQMQVRPNAAGVTGGLITSNSLVNTLNRSDTAPTGSVWTAHVTGTAPGPEAGTGITPPGIGQETPGLDFFTFRTRDEVVSAKSPECAKAGVTNEVAVRSANLAVAEPDAVSGQVPEALGSPVGKLTVCYLYTSNEGYGVATIATLKTSRGTFDIKARGECKSKPTPASSMLLVQACSLPVGTGSTKGGLVTSNGLIEKGKPASAANSAVWTYALFGAPAA
ncbi:MAG: hypothetical protein JHD16_08310 [Solirubrobacteraceae bacterium]|nr:hypothetical protein [Solirubrobacteraceae bacterium]